MSLEKSRIEVDFSWGGGRRAGSRRQACREAHCLVPWWLRQWVCLQCRRPGFHPGAGKIPWRVDSLPTPVFLCFPGGSTGKESTCNVGDLGLIPGLGSSPGEEISHPLQYSWASLVAQLVKNPPAMQETLVQSLGCEDPLGKGKATHSSILAWRIPWTVQSMGLQRLGHDWVNFQLVFLPVQRFPWCTLHIN